MKRELQLKLEAHAKAHPVVQKALSLFGGEVRGVRRGPCAVVFAPSLVSGRQANEGREVTGDDVAAVAQCRDHEITHHQQAVVHHREAVGPLFAFAGPSITWPAAVSRV